MKKLTKTKLTKDQVKAGIYIGEKFKAERIPLRKANDIKTMYEAQFGRKAFIITNHGEDLAILLPLYQSGK